MWGINNYQYGYLWIVGRSIADKRDDIIGIRVLPGFRINFLGCSRFAGNFDTGNFSPASGTAVYDTHEDIAHGLAGCLGNNLTDNLRLGFTDDLPVLILNVFYNIRLHELASVGHRTDRR